MFVFVNRVRSVAAALLSLMLVLGLAIPTASGQEWAEKMFESQKVDFGVVARGADAVHRLKLKNIYKETVHISNVRTTCGCSAAEPSQTTLTSREEAYIKISMDTRKFTRRKDSNVIVTIDAPYYAEVRIPVTAYIRTDVVLTPGSANFGPVETGAGGQRTLNVAYAGRANWSIESVESKNPFITARAVETARGNGRVTYDLLVELDKSAPLGPIRDQITLITDDANSPRVPILVEAKVESDITVTPAIVSLGMMTPGQEKRVSVVLRGRRPFVIEKIEADSDTGAFRVRLPNDERIVHVLPLTVTPPGEPGNFSESFTVTIAGRDEPITFQASGKIVASN